MKRIFALLLTAGVTLAGLLPVAHAQAAEAPDALIQRVSTDTLAKIKADKDIQNGDLSKLSALVDGTVMPYVDFERMTALAVGRGWRDATPDQKTKLQTEFRALLLRTYSGALSQVKDQSIRLKPFHAEATDTDVVVRSEVVQPSAEPIQLDYRLSKNGDAWKIYDLNVLGVWLIQTYRSQFAQEINANGIDGLIKSLHDKNQSMDSGKKS